MNWFLDNLATIVVGVILLIAVVLALRSMLKTYKSGECGGGCSGCTCAGACHHETTEENEAI